MYFVIENEERKMIDQAVIDRINQGDVKAFECLYNDYFVYLCACANSYIFNAEEAQDIVNEVFMKLWYKRGDLFFPIHPYLVRSVQNGCLNYLRSLHSRERVVQMYIRDCYSSVVRPLKELKGFHKITLQPGESQTVTFYITAKELSFYDIDMNYGVEKGEFEVMIGNSSRDIDLQRELFTIK